jgi:oligopeptide transport system permease protein
MKRSLYLQHVLEQFRKNKMALIGAVLLLFIMLLVFLGNFFSPYTYCGIDMDNKNLAPSLTHLFGTDELGRDVFTRVCFGIRISLFVGTMAALLDLFLGVVWGSIAAFFGGFLDEVMMRLCDIFYAIPHLLIVIMLMVVMGPGLFTIIIALALTGWINMARITRGQILQIKNMEFVKASMAIGTSNFRIIFRHLIPNISGPIIATMTLTIPTAIFAEAFLSFLGLGVQAPVASLGVMINDALCALRYYPWRLFFPAVIIIVIMLAFNLIGDGLRDAMDVKEL